MIESLTSPDSIAVIGASADQAKIGYQVLNNLKNAGYAGSIFPVNPKGGDILGLNVYQSVSEILETPTLAVIIIPSKFVKDSVLECAKKGVKALIIITAGFSETGDEGRVLEEEIKQICRENQIALLGPNCLGLINTDNNMNATFAGSMPKSGKISFISQSGAVISSMIDWSKTATVGFSKIFSLGNKALITEADLLEYLYNDKNTEVIIGYIERLVVDEKLTTILKKYSKIKPTIILFGGKSEFGAKAAASHTGSIVSSYVAVRTYLEQSGVILAESLEELLIFAQIFSSYQSVADKNVAIITNAGGPGIAASDALAKYGLKMAELSDETVEKLGQNLREEANIQNPIDVLGDASELEYQKAIEIVSADPKVDSMVVILTPQSSTKIPEIAQVIANYKGEKPLVSAFIGGESLILAKGIIEASDKPCFAFPEEAVLAVRTLADFCLSKVEINLANYKNAKIFEMADKTAALDKFKLPTLKYYETSEADELKKYANQIGYPVVLKTADPTAHKSDTGGLVLDIKNDLELDAAFEKVGSPAIVGKMVKGKFEILLGIKKDENVGTSILFGTGGIYSETYKDFSYRIAPINADMAKEMIMETKIGEILNGARGQHKFDLDQLAKTIVNAAKFADNYSNITEVDFNPIIAAIDGYYAVDVRVITK